MTYMGPGMEPAELAASEGGYCEERNESLVLLRSRLLCRWDRFMGVVQCGTNSG